MTVEYVRAVDVADPGLDEPLLSLEYVPPLLPVVGERVEVQGRKYPLLVIKRTWLVSEQGVKVRVRLREMAP